MSFVAALVVAVAPLDAPAVEPPAMLLSLDRVAHGFGAMLRHLNVIADAVPPGSGAPPASAVPSVAPPSAPAAGTPSADSTAAPTPAPSSSAGSPAYGKGGPLTLAVTGNLVASQQVTSNTFGGASSGSGQQTAGAILSLGRRTPKTAFSMTFPTAVSRQKIAVGQATAEFDTVRESLLYQPQTIGALGLLPLGATVRSFGLLFPRRNGDVLFYVGPTQSTTTTLAVRGARLRLLQRRGLIGIGLYDAKIEGTSGRIDGLTVGYATSPTRVSGAAEIGVERTSGIAGVADGLSFALQGRLDAGSLDQYASLTVRHFPGNFTPLTGIFGQGDKLVGANYRRTYKGASYTVDITREVTSNMGSSTDSLRRAFTFSRPIGKAGTILASLGDQRVNSPDDRAWSATSNVGYTTIVRDIGVTFGLSQQRSTDAVGGSQSSFNTTFGLSKPFGLANVQSTVGYARQTAPAGNNTSLNFSLGATRPVGRTSFGLSAQLARQITNGSNGTTIAPALTVTRRLSPALTLSMSATTQLRSDTVQPMQSGRSSQISFNLGAPFSFGNGVVSGRANPRLPATLAGTIQNDSSAPSAFGQNPLAGVNNIAVVLDNQRIVRTDAQGRFEFRFLPAGRHVLTIDPATLPRGITADSPAVPIELAGGTTSQIVLGIGTWGGIVGSVSGLDASGGRIPVSGATLILDGTNARSVTAPDGAFGFGRLGAGTHTIEVVVDTLPANIGLETYKKSVDVQIGEVARLEFSGSPLGSISGKLVYDKSTEKRAGKGVLNAYVVAQPGEHAVITDEDGSFIVDNLSAGTYTLSVDPETLPEDFAITSTPEVPVTLGAGSRVGGVVFEAGFKERPVVFSYKQGEINVLNVAIAAARVPPGATTPVRVTTSLAAKSVVAKGFGSVVTLVPGEKTNQWTGTLSVPKGTPPGQYDVSFEASGKAPGSATSALIVDPNVSLATIAIEPRNPGRGQFVHVRARFLVNARAGDSITWQDGATTVLAKPRTGRVFEFDVKVTAIPFSGLLVTQGGGLPITLIR